MKKFDLQMFAEAVQGKKIVYLFRVLKNAANKAAVAMAFVTENTRTKSKDADSTATKDGAIRTPGASEVEISATAILAKGDTLHEELEAAMDNDELIEIWEVNLEEPVAEAQNQFKGTYYQGYLTEFELTSSAEDFAEAATTFAVNGTGAKGNVTVSVEQQEMAAYVFTDTQKTGA